MRLIRSAAAVAFSATLAGGVVVAQQPTPSAGEQQQQRSQAGLQAMDGQTVTLTGCLKREADVPGRQPSVAEQAGILRDVILANAQVKSASPSGGTGTPGATGTAPSAGASGMNVKLLEVDNQEMNTNLNRQVEVTGRLQVSKAGPAVGAGRGGTGTPGTGATTGTGTPAGGTGTTGTEATGRRTGSAPGNQDDLPELEVQSIRVVSQSCTGAKQ